MHEAGRVVNARLAQGHPRKPSLQITRQSKQNMAKPGATAINKALKRLIAADQARGLSTVVFDIGDAAQMAAIGAAAVLNEKDDRGAKLAVDAIHTAHTPDYIMLLDGPDVVPHVSLNRIPGVTDQDNTTDSDLPFASSAGFSRQASAYLAVARVVGPYCPRRRGETDETELISLIDASIAHATRPAAGICRLFRTHCRQMESFDPE